MALLAGSVVMEQGVRALNQKSVDLDYNFFYEEGGETLTGFPERCWMPCAQKHSR